MINRPEGVGQNPELQSFIDNEARQPDPELALERDGVFSSASHIESGQQTYTLAAIVGQEAVAGAAEVGSGEEMTDTLSMTELFAAYQLAAGRHIIPVTKKTRSGIIVIGALEEADFLQEKPFQE